MRVEVIVASLLNDTRIGTISGMDDDRRQTRSFPQQGRERMILPQPISALGTGQPNMEAPMLARMSPERVFMMGDNPALPRMPKAPKLLDFFRLRFSDITYRHLLQSAKTALDAGQDEKVIIACLLHDISNGAFMRTEHGYWSAQFVAPYVSEEVAWAIQYHQALRYFADESVGFKYPGCLQPVLRPGLRAAATTSNRPTAKPARTVGI